MGKTLSKYTAAITFFDKNLLILSVTNGSAFITSSATHIGATVGTTSARFSLVFSISNINALKLLKP